MMSHPCTQTRTLPTLQFVHNTEQLASHRAGTPPQEHPSVTTSGFLLLVQLSFHLLGRVFSLRSPCVIYMYHIYPCNPQ